MSHEETYKVPCPRCNASVGRSCWQVATFQANGKKMWCPPHSPRIAAAVKAQTEEKP